MQFSESWLRTLCNPPLDTATLAHVMTMAGLEVEEISPVAPSFDLVVIAKIVACEKHPDADRLKLCQVDAGKHGVLQIVCGAPNAAEGLMVPCALVGARLPGIEIKKAKVRGIESFGMLCSARELGVSESADGLMVLPSDAPIGSDIRGYLNLDDQLLTLKLTPNRADCLSLTGIAREVSALTGAPLVVPEVSCVPQLHEAFRRVRLEAPSACPRYCGRIIQGVDAKAVTPDWMRQRLERCGIRPISAIVDVTNYVLLELGQPMHAFDNDKLEGDLRVRFPEIAERLQLLNGQDIELAADTLLIADDRGPLALAGIMGGEFSSVTDATRNVFLEAAYFSPDVIAGKARALGFASDSSYRFERGVDFNLQIRALERATQLMVEICGGKCGPLTEVIDSTNLPQVKPVSLTVSRVARVLGVDFAADQMAALLMSLGFGVQQISSDCFSVTPPSYRFDVAIEEDLIEELARLYGYDNIPAHPPVAKAAMLEVDESRRSPMQIRRLVVGRGYQETVNFSFVEAEWESDFAANDSPIVLANPIASQLSVMRSSLLGGLVSVLKTNQKRQQQRVRVFEIGRCFSRDRNSTTRTGFQQPVRLAGLAAGSALGEQWGAPDTPVDFYDVKSDVESLFPGRALRFDKCEHPALHPGRAAHVILDGQVMGCVGELHPRWVQKYELGTAPVVFELELESLMATPLPVNREISRFPAVFRDVAVIVEQRLPWQSLLDGLLAAPCPVVKAIELFDVYQGKGVPEGRKSLAFRVVMQDTQRTLEEVEIESAISSLVSVAKERFGAELRG